MRHALFIALSGCALLTVRGPDLARQSEKPTAAPVCDQNPWFPIAFDTYLGTAAIVSSSVYANSCDANNRCAEATALVLGAVVVAGLELYSVVTSYRRRTDCVAARLDYQHELALERDRVQETIDEAHVRAQEAAEAAAQRRRERDREPGPLMPPHGGSNAPTPGSDTP